MGESRRAETANFLLERKGLVRRQQALSVCKEYLSEMIRQSKKTETKPRAGIVSREKHHSHVLLVDVGSMTLILVWFINF